MLVCVKVLRVLFNILAGLTFLFMFFLPFNLAVHFCADISFSALLTLHFLTPLLLWIFSIYGLP